MKTVVGTLLGVCIVIEQPSSHVRATSIATRRCTGCIFGSRALVKPGLASFCRHALQVDAHLVACALVVWVGFACSWISRVRAAERARIDADAGRVFL
ncbi:hypothetical protein PF003_g12984 [Phytophthora fragariae]|nr:hypothetical protein PF003_g12984 [Phytophthora fragariae]